MKPNFQDMLNQMEADLRVGNAQKVARTLGSINSAELSRLERVQFAKVARRAGCISFGLRLLTPLIHRDRNQWREDASAQELAEYGVLLQYCGAVTEALKTLERVNRADVPQAHLYQAFCHFNRWEYAESIGPLEEYLKADIAPYARLVGKVNLAAAFVSTLQKERALELLRENIEIAEKESHSRLMANCLELRSQLHIAEGKFVEARKDLVRAAEIIGGTDARDGLYVRKWLAVCETLQSAEDQALLRFRETSLKNGHWESVRESDLYLLKFKFDKERFHKLIFGTPYPAYRWRVCNYLGEMPDRPEYIQGDAKGTVFDLQTGSLDGRKMRGAGMKTHQLISVLSRDFYAPAKIGGLFAEIFPDEHFDINSSPDRVHQILRRARKWIAGENLPLKIQSKGEFYSLSLGKGIALKTSLVNSEVSVPALHFEEMRKVAGAREFSAREIQEKMGLSNWGLHNLLSWAAERSLIVRLKWGPSTKYRISA